MNLKDCMKKLSNLMENTVPKEIIEEKDQEKK